MTQAPIIEAKFQSPTSESRPPLPPFTRESAVQKVRLAEDAWNSRNPERVALAYSVDSNWRNRSEFVNGRQEIVAFLTRKWNKELEYRLVKELWGSTGIGSQCALLTSGAMTPVIGSDLTETRIGNSMNRV